MDNDGISTKVSVLGDKEYKKALQDIGRRLTVLNTEMAATTSAFGEQADSMEAMQAKAAGLKSVYEAQAEKVRLIAEQLNKAKGEYEENSKQVQDLQIALNRARAAMNKTGSEIQKNDRAMESLAASTAKAATEEKTADSEADKLKQTLGDSAAKCAAYDQQLREVERSLKRSSDQSAGLAEKQELLQRKYETQGQACDELASAYRKSVQESGEFSAESVALSKKLQDQKDALYKTADELESNAKAMEEAAGLSTTLALNTDQTTGALEEQANAADEAENSTSALGSAMSGAGEIAKGAMVAGLTAAAAAVAALSAAALEGAKQIVQLGTDYRQAANQLSAQTGATGDELTELGDIAQEVYKNNFGDNIADVNDALATTKVNTGLMGDELKKATENGYLLRDTFGMDIAESSRTASALMQKFGIDAETAYNLIAQGAQRGANQNGDLLDVLSEYAPKYAEMGLSAEDMMTTLISGAENGVFQIDKVGDAVKEFSIRAIDGSDTTKEAFEELGLKASYVSAEISEGGPQARAAFLQVVQALQKVEDPLKRNQLAVSLFGTQFEDLGEGALPILASIAEGGDLSADALGQINEVKYNDAASALEGVKRKIQSEFLPLASNMQSLIVGTLSTIDTALADGFQPEDVRVIGEAIASAMMEGVATIDTLFTENTDIITDMLDSAVRVITEALPAFVDAILPAAMGLLQSIVDAITGNIDPLAALAADIVTQVAGFLTENASGLFSAAADLVFGLAQGIGEALPELLPAAADMIGELALGLGEKLPDIVSVGMDVLGNLVTGISDALPKLTDKVPEIIGTIISGIGEKLPDIVSQGFDILTNLITGLGDAIPDLAAKMPEIIGEIKDAFLAIDWLELGNNLLTGLWGGLKAAWEALRDSILGVFSGIWDAVLELFGIASPSTVAEEAGGFILDGLLLGFESAVDAVCETVKKIFGKIWDAIKSIFGFGSESEESKEAKTAGQDIMTGMKDGITGSEEDVKTAVKNASQAVLDTFKTELGVTEGNSTKTKPMGEGIAKGIADGLSASTAETFAGGAAVVANAVTGALNAAFGVEGTGFLGSGGDSAKKFEAIGAAVCKAIADGITNNTQNTEAVKTAITGVANAAYEAAVTEMATGITGSSETVNAAVDTVATAALEAAAAILTADAGGKVGKAFMDGIRLAILNARPGLSSAATLTASGAHNATKAELSQSKGQSIGSVFVQSIRAGISGQQSQVSSAAQSLGSGALSALWSAVGSGGSRFEAIGNAIAQGMARGIRNGSGSIQSAARAAAQAAYNAAKQALDIRSPSHKMEAIGMQYGAGFAGGIEQSIQDVSRSARMLSEIAASETAAGAASFPALSQPQIDYERLGEAVAEANRRAGLGKAVLDVNGKRMAETLEPSVSRATYQRAGRTVTGRAARMVLA